MNAPYQLQPSAAATFDQRVAPQPPQRVNELDRLMSKSFQPMDLLEDRNFDKLWRMAEALSGSALSVPKELKGNIGDCLAVVTQAMIWGLNPFAVAQAAHVINGKLGYEAKLINSVVMQAGAIRGSFHYEYRGEGMGLECRVGAILAGENNITWGEWLKNGDCVVRNSPLWKTNPRMQLGYLQVKNWVRAYTPGPLLGIYTNDELGDADAFPLPPAQHTEAEAEAAKQEAARAEALRALKAQQDTAADAGVDAYQKFWKDAGAANRKLLADRHETAKQRAIDTDAQRRADALAQAEAEAKKRAETQPDPATGEIPAGKPAGEHDDFLADMDAASQKIGGHP